MLHTLKTFCQTHPKTAAILAFATLAGFVTILIVQAYRKFSRGPDDFDALGEAGFPAPSGTGEPRPVPLTPCAKCCRKPPAVECGFCTPPYWDGFDGPSYPVGFGVINKSPTPDIGVGPVPYDPAHDVSHSNIGPGVD